MKTLVIIAIFSILITGCSKQSVEEVANEVTEFKLTIPNSYSLAEPISEDDQWLKTFREGNGYQDEWETWVWRLTDITIADGIKVYARNLDEKQFLVTGCDEFSLLSVDFRISEVGETGFYSGEHNVKLTPSGNYIVCLAQNPSVYIHGLPINCKVKRNGDWAFQFEELSVIWKKLDTPQ